MISQPPSHQYYAEPTVAIWPSSVRDSDRCLVTIQLRLSIPCPNLEEARQVAKQFSGGVFVEPRDRELMGSSLIKGGPRATVGPRIDADGVIED